MGFRNYQRRRIRAEPSLTFPRDPLTTLFPEELRPRGHTRPESWNQRGQTRGQTLIFGGWRWETHPRPSEAQDCPLWAVTQGNPSLGQPQGLSWVETRGLGQGTGLWVPNSCPQGPPSAREGDCATAISPETASLSLPSPGKKGAGKGGHRDVSGRDTPT